jgi:LDH2 family malate/lactate/ureidoglycolate dehydrogenase
MMQRVPVDQLTEQTLCALELAGFTAAERPQIEEVYTYAALRGNYQPYIGWAVSGILPKEPSGPIVTHQRGRVAAVLDGNGSHGILVMREAAKKATGLAAEAGLGIVGTRNTSAGTAAVGWYVRTIAAAGHVGVAFSGSASRVAAFGSFERVFGTNPIAAAFPTFADPVVVDVASSSIPLFRVMEAQLLASRLPPLTAFSRDGLVTDDPEAALLGALMPMGGHKGSALAFLVEALTGPLLEQPSPGDQRTHGDLLIALEPGILTDRASYFDGMSRLIESVKSSKPLPGTLEVLVPGERGDRSAAQCLERGYVEVDARVWAGFLTAINDAERQLT